MIREVIFGQVLGKASHYKIADNRVSGERHITLDEAYRAYSRSFREQCHIYAGRGIDRPFLLYVHVWYINSRFDLDGSLKTILDELQAVKAITDDNLCVGIMAKKHIDPQNPRVEFAIGELEPRLF
jgi:Holliday junction resolvase RusA-like endonuclease